MSNIKRGLGFLPYYDFPEQPTRLKEALANVGQGLSTPFLLGADIQKMLSPYNFVPKAAEFLTQPNPEYVKQLDDEFKSTILSGQPIENEPIQLGSGVMMSPGESRARFGSPSYGQMPDLAIGDDAEAIQQKLEDIRIDKNVATDPKGGDKSLEGGEEAIANLFDTSIKGYLDRMKLKKPGEVTKEKTIEEYRKEFAKATGIDVSGKPDTKDAMIAFGLSLLQNKAGKKFDVGKMLKSVGSAGEKAMPLLTKAKSEAKAAAASAGKYALDMRSVDKTKREAAETKAMDRKGYFIVPKGKDGGSSPSDFLANADKGSIEELNVFELDALYKTKGFTDKYNVYPAATHGAITAAAMNDEDVGAQYETGKASNIPLFDGADKSLDIAVKYVNPNSLKKGEYLPPMHVGSREADLGKVRNLEKQVDAQEKLFKDIAENLNRTDVDVFAQAGSSIVQGFRNLGFNISGDTTPLKQIETLLTQLKAENAAAILGESGKTLSDNDRKMVSEIVGEINFTEGDEAELTRKLGRLYGKIVQTGRRNVQQAYANLASYGVEGASQYLDTASSMPFSSAVGTLDTNIGNVANTKLRIGKDGIYEIVGI